MTYLALVSPEGRVVTANNPQLRWKSSAIQLPRWTPGKSRLYKLDHRSFWWRDEERVQGVGRFALKPDGALALDLTAPLPLSVRSVSSSTAAGNRIAVETAPFTSRVLGWTKTGWRTIVESFPVVEGREKPERADVYLNRNGDAVCVVSTSRLSRAAVFCYGTIYRINVDTFTNETLIPGFGVVQSVLASDDGWYITSLFDRKVRTRRLHLPTTTHRVLWEPFADGAIVAPFVSGGITVYDQAKGGLRLGTSQVGKVPAGVPSTSLYYWRGIGAVSDVPEAQTIYINERGFHRPVPGESSPLFLVPSLPTVSSF